MEEKAFIMLMLLHPWFPYIFGATMLIIIVSFFIAGWRLATYKNRDRIKWALTIAISGFYGLAILVALPTKKGEKQ